MPYFHFTLHAYRSWGPDHEQGYVQRGESGVKRPDERLAACRDSLANDPPVIFNSAQMQLLVNETMETCRRRGCKAHAVAVTATHVHIVASWSIEATPAKMQEGLKSGLGYCLSRALGTTGHRWFSRGGEPARVKDHAHLFHLLNDYLPRHAAEEGGVFRSFADQKDSKCGSPDPCLG